MAGSRGLRRGLSNAKGNFPKPVDNNGIVAWVADSPSKRPVTASICQFDSKRAIHDSFPRLGEQSRERSGTFQNATEDNPARTQESDLSYSLIWNHNIRLSLQGD